MIRVNLLERKALKKKFQFQLSQKLAAGCSLILILATLFVGWRYWSLGKASAQLDADLVAAQQETTRLHSIIQQVQQFEQRRTQLQQRVSLIEELRRNQTGPVHMLDQISRALPPMLWLTELKQTAGSSDVLIDGKCSTLTSLSDFVSNLETSGYFQRSVEIVSSVSETSTTAGETIKFQVKAVFKTPGDVKAGSNTNAAGAAAAAPRTGA
jgi:type IV pilus assembly protein PilN